MIRDESGVGEIPSGGQFQLEAAWKTESFADEMAQGALGWIWGMSRATLPIPGFRTVAQARENAGALEFGPLNADTIAEINMVLGNGA